MFVAYSTKLATQSFVVSSESGKGNACFRCFSGLRWSPFSAPLCECGANVSIPRSFNVNRPFSVYPVCIASVKVLCALGERKKDDRGLSD